MIKPIITDTQANYILFFYKYYQENNKFPKQAEIAKALVVSQTAVNGMIHRLETRGFIERSRGKIVLIPDIVLEACQKKVTR
jgi:DNA-binding MarR family transcriptional regulator